MSEPVTGNNTRKIDLLIQQGSRIEAVLVSIEKRVDGFDNRLGKVEDRLSSSEKVLASLDRRMDGIDTRLGKVEDRLLSSEHRAAAVEAKVGEMAGVLGTWNRVWAIGVPIVGSCLIGTFYQGYDTKAKMSETENKIGARFERLDARLDARLGADDDLKARVARLEAKVGVQPHTP